MKKGFSLIEIMVVVFILASLAGGIYVVYSPDKEEVYYTNVRTSLREYTRALQKWNNEFYARFGRFPNVPGTNMLIYVNGDYDPKIFSAYISASVNYSGGSLSDVRRFALENEYISFRTGFNHTDPIVVYKGEQLKSRWR